MRRLGLRTILALTAAVAIGLLGQLPAVADSPIQPNNRPTPVAGRTNGEMPDSDLINVAPNCRALRAAAPSLGLLLASARARGVTVTTEECYRPLSGEVAAQQNWTAAGNSACAAPVNTSPSGKPQGTSMHGWGKAVDFAFGGGSFGSAGYQYLKQAAGGYGWNHPGWAEPGGSACPEAWHWEWVGDGGEMHASAVRADVVGLLPSADDQGYATVTGLGAVAARGSAVDRGSAAGIPLNWLIVGASPTADRLGYWMVGSDGGIFGFGDAAFFGSTGGMHLNQPVVGMAATPTGRGYWLVAADGGIFSFGDARFFGSTGAMHLNKPIVAMAATPTGAGYWLIASDGGIFSFGDARFFGSTGAIRLNQPVVGGAATADGNGYWLVASDGGVFNFGDAGFLGSAGGHPPAQSVVSLTATRTGQGYWLTVVNGDVLPFGDAKSFGSG
jgi:hypothetical protein